MNHVGVPAIIRLYPSGRNGSLKPILPGYRCVCRVDRSTDRAPGYSIYLNLNGPLGPGQALYIEADFLVDYAVRSIREASGKFYLWEGEIFGEGILV